MIKKNKIKSYLTFHLGEELFALHVVSVINILELVKITKVPKAPDFMRGVINLRGDVLPVIDLRQKFGMPPIEFTKLTCILVLEVKIENESIKIGALVDEVNEVFEYENDDILPPPSIGKSYKTDFLIGMIERNEKFIMIMDGNKLFSNIEIESIKQVDTVNEINKE